MYETHIFPLSFSAAASRAEGGLAAENASDRADQHDDADDAYAHQFHSFKKFHHVLVNCCVNGWGNYVVKI